MATISDKTDVVTENAVATTDGKVDVAMKDVATGTPNTLAEVSPGIKDVNVDDAGPGNNIFGNRDEVLRANAPKILYTLKWSDHEAPGVTKPSFYSSVPFDDLRVTEDKVSKRYQAPDELSELVVEVISHITGTTEQDRLKRQAEGYIAPAPLPPLPPALGPRPIRIPEPSYGPPPLPYDEPPIEPLVNSYKLTEIAISAIGKQIIVVKSVQLKMALHSILKDYSTQFTYPNEYEYPYVGHTSITQPL